MLPCVYIPDESSEFFLHASVRSEKDVVKIRLLAVLAFSGWTAVCNFAFLGFVTLIKKVSRPAESSPERVESLRGQKSTRAHWMISATSPNQGLVAG